MEHGLEEFNLFIGKMELVEAPILEKINFFSYDGRAISRIKRGVDFPL